MQCIFSTTLTKPYAEFKPHVYWWKRRKRDSTLQSYRHVCFHKMYMTLLCGNSARDRDCMHLSHSVRCERNLNDDVMSTTALAKQLFSEWITYKHDRRNATGNWTNPGKPCASPHTFMPRTQHVPHAKDFSGMLKLRPRGCVICTVLRPSQGYPWPCSSWPRQLIPSRCSIILLAREQYAAEVAGCFFVVECFSRCAIDWIFYVYCSRKAHATSKWRPQEGTCTQVLDCNIPLWDWQYFL